MPPPCRPVRFGLLSAAERAHRFDIRLLAQALFQLWMWPLLKENDDAIDNWSARMDRWLNGKTVLITGGSKGIGLATAQSFAGEGANLVLVARTPGDLQRASSGILAQHPEISVSVESVDLSQQGSAALLAALAMPRAGRNC